MSLTQSTPLRRDMGRTRDVSGRDSAIELLRVLAMCGVVVLHYNNIEIGGGLKWAEGANRWVLIGLESVFICAVDLYILISGYFLSASDRRRAIKPIEMVVQVVLFGLAVGLLRAALQGNWSLMSILGPAIPNNYFVTLYVVVYLLSPYLNLLFRRLSDERMAFLTGLLMTLFSLWLTTLDLVENITGYAFTGMSTVNAYESQSGYTIVNFMLLYTLGTYLRRREGQPDKRPWYVFFAAFVGNTLVLTMWANWFPGSAWAYSNPLVIANACLIFLAFRQWRLSSKTVRILAKGAFSCYLLHGIFITRIGIERAVTGSTGGLLIHVALSAMGLYLICWVAWVVWNAVTARFFHWIGGKLTVWDDKISLTDEE